MDDDGRTPPGDSEDLFSVPTTARWDPSESTTADLMGRQSMGGKEDAYFANFPQELIEQGYSAVKQIVNNQQCAIYVCSPPSGKLIARRIGEVERRLLSDDLVVVKALHEDYKSWMLEALTEEANVLSQLNVPNVPYFYDKQLVGVQYPYIVQEYVKGIDLSALLERQSQGLTNRYNKEQTQYLVGKLIGIVADVHERLFLHLDIKPANIVISSADHEPWLVDFGLARHDLSRSRPSRWFAGTVAYAPPEQLSQGSIDKYSDVFALCMLLAEVLTGRNLRDPDGSAELKHQLQGNDEGDVEYAEHHFRTVPEIGLLPSEYRPILEPGLRRNSTDRYKSATELRSSFRAAFPRISKPTIELDNMALVHSESGSDSYIAPDSDRPKNSNEAARRHMFYLAYDIAHGSTSAKLRMLIYGVVAGLLIGCISALIANYFLLSESIV